MNIFQAAENGNIKRIKTLLRKGIDIDNRDEEGNTPLILASLYTSSTSSIATVKYLLDRGADINALNYTRMNALIYVSDNTNTTSSLETVKYSVFIYENRISV
jgi:ankyrin repeat protein